MAADAPPPANGGVAGGLVARAELLVGRRFLLRAAFFQRPLRLLLRAFLRLRGSLHAVSLPLCPERGRTVDEDVVEGGLQARCDGAHEYRALAQARDLDARRVRQP